MLACLYHGDFWVFKKTQTMEDMSVPSQHLRH
jgi:hypothetical protein